MVCLDFSPSAAAGRRCSVALPIQVSRAAAVRSERQSEAMVFADDSGVETAGYGRRGRVFLRPCHQRAGALCMHVDDVLLGGNGAAYRASVDVTLRYPSKLGGTQLFLTAVYRAKGCCGFCLFPAVILDGNTVGCPGHHCTLGFLGKSVPAW